MILGCMILVSFPRICGAQTCSSDAVQRAAENVKAIQGRMLEIKGDEDGLDYEVKPAAVEGIRAIKEALAKTIDEYMRCAPEATPDVKAIEGALANLVGANKPEAPFRPETDKTPAQTDHIYGTHLKIEVTWPDANLQLVAVKARFGVGCGMDTMLLMYKLEGRIWRQKLRWQSGDYKEVSGAFGDFFEFVLFPDKEPGQWIVVVAHGTPWCTSRFSAYDIDLIRPARGPVPQQLLLHRHDGYVREIDPVMKNVPGGFELKLETTDLDMDIMTRMGIYRYLVVDGKLQRVQPIALNGRDFVDEWLQSPWSDAVQWSATAKVSDLRTEHARIAKEIDPKGTSHPQFTYGPVRSCTGDPKLFQVELDEEPGTPTFYQIEEGKNSFTMTSALSTPDSRCNGGDLMRKR
jgi:hypothetical protein